MLKGWNLSNTSKPLLKNKKLVLKVKTQRQVRSKAYHMCCAHTLWLAQMICLRKHSGWIAASTFSPPFLTVSDRGDIERGTTAGTFSHICGLALSEPVVPWAFQLGPTCPESPRLVASAELQKVHKPKGLAYIKGSVSSENKGQHQPWTQDLMLMAKNV